MIKNISIIFISIFLLYNIYIMLKLFWKEVTIWQEEKEENKEEKL